MALDNRGTFDPATARRSMGCRGRWRSLIGDHLFDMAHLRSSATFLGADCIRLDHDRVTRRGRRLRGRLVIETNLATR
jgi:hypothetical protein